MKMILIGFIFLSTSTFFQTFAEAKSKCEESDFLSIECNLEFLKKDVIKHPMYKATQKEVLKRLTPDYQALRNGVLIINKAKCSTEEIRLKDEYIYVSSSCSSVIKYGDEEKNTPQLIQILVKAKYISEYESFIPEIESISLKEISQQ